MWIGEQIDAFGIGNGISLLIMAGHFGTNAHRSQRDYWSRFCVMGIAIGSDTGIEKNCYY